MGKTYQREGVTVELDDDIPESLLDAGPEAAQRPKDLDVDRIYAEECATEGERP